MQYLVKLILQQDSDILDFRCDLVHLREASLFSISTINSEISNMNHSISSGNVFVDNTLIDLAEKELLIQTDKGGIFTAMKSSLMDIDVIPYTKFVPIAHKLISALEIEVSNADRQYRDLLSYVGEDPELGSDNFFGTLHTFCEEVESSVQEV